MSVEISTIRTAADTAPAIIHNAPTGLDPATVAAVTELLRTAADLTRAQRPIVLHTPPAPAPAVAPHTAAYGAHAYIPAPPPSVAAGGPWRRRVLFGDRVLWFGAGMAFSGITGALVAMAAGNIWVLTISAAGALLWPVGGIAINIAERREQYRARA